MFALRRQPFGWSALKRPQKLMPYEYRKIPLGEGHSPEFSNSNPVLLGIGLSISKLNPERSPAEKNARLASTARPPNWIPVNSNQNRQSTPYFIYWWEGTEETKNYFSVITISFDYLVGEG